MSLRELKNQIEQDPEHWKLSFMQFVDDFRHDKELSALREPFDGPAGRWDALLASTAETLCRESGLEPPSWLWRVPACKEPWFVSGLENLKAIALAESPLPFRLRKIFVLDNFLSRV